MWCLPCFKPSAKPDPSGDLFEDDLDIALAKSRREDVITRQKRLEEDENFARAIQESSNLEEASRRRQQEKEEERRRRAREKTERQLHNKSALEDEEDKQLAKALEESLKERRKQLEDEQVKKDGELALIIQKRLNMSESPPPREENNNISRIAPLNLDEQLAKALEESLKAKGKGKQYEDDQVKKDGEFAVIVQESLNMSESPSRLEENNNLSPRTSLDEDEQLAKALEESLKGKGQIMQSEDEVEDGKLLEGNPPRSMCGGCNSGVEHSRSVNILGVLWHPRCFCCCACDKLISIYEVENHVSNSRGKFHKSCYERYCYVCRERKMKHFCHHPFWGERYCKSHEADGTPKCCSCERLEPRGTNFVMLGDGRLLCLECMDSAVMDSDECQPLHFDMRDFFDGLQMTIKKPFPFLLVEKQALNKAEKEEKIDYEYEVVTRGICLSEAQTVTSVSKGPRMGPNRELIGMDTESQWVDRECEVTAILILYGLPRLLTGYILAHEMMHAYLRLNGYRNLNKVLEEGLCQVLGHMWLESQTYATADATEASSSSSPTPAANASKKGEWSDFEKKLVDFYKNQIETDESPVYGVGFKIVNLMVETSSLQETLKKILRGSCKRSQIQSSESARL